MWTASSLEHNRQKLYEELKSGSVKGLKAIGDFTVDQEWADKLFVSARIVNNQGQPLTLTVKLLPSKSTIAAKVNGSEVEVTTNADGSFAIPTSAAGDVIDLTVTPIPDAIGTVSSDMTCGYFSVFDSSTLTINQGVTVTLNNPGRNFNFFDKSKIELHGTLAGSAGSDATWMDRSYINVYLSDGAKYTVTGLSCMDGDSYLVYYGYDAATDGNGTVSVKNGSTDVTSTSKGYKTTTYTFTATPSDGYKFVNWTKGAGGDVLGTDASINVTCEQNGQYQVYANFEEDAPATFSVTLADGTEDAENWEITPNTDLTGGETVTIKYKGTKKVKSVKAVKK